MSRYSEASDIVEKTTKQMIDLLENCENEVSAEKMATIQLNALSTQLSGIYNILTDIALSLAVIADKESRE